MKIITVNTKKFGIKEIFVDDEDFEALNKIKWYIYKTPATFYASSPKMKTSIHRLILGVTNPNIFVDHKDRNGLNNQRNNIRPCTRSENGKNRRSSGKSKYLGISLCVTKNKSKDGSINECRRWVAAIGDNKKIFYLGRYKTEEEAALAYDKAAKIRHGEFANLNFK